MNTIDKLTGRQNQILKHFYRTNETISSEFLSTSVGVSTKTIKKEMQEITLIIHRNGAQITSKTGSGYSLKIINHDIFEDFLKFNNENNSTITNLPFLYQRAHYIIRRLLSSLTPVTINQLSEELYTSRTTINTDLIVVKEILEGYNIKLVSKPHHGLIYEGLESSVRFCLVDEYKYYTIHNLFVEEKVYQSYFEAEETLIHTIKEAIYETQRNDERLEISYQNIMILVRLILISYKRSAFSALPLYDEDESYEIRTRASFHVAKQILKAVAQELKHEFKLNDYCMLALYIVCYRNFSSPDNVARKEIYYSSYQLAEEIIAYLSQNNSFTVLDGDVLLTSALALHLMPLLNRLKYCVKLSNIEVINIKQNSISSIELATQTAYYLKNKHQLILPEDEVVFLAYVFHPTFGRYNRNTKRKNILLINSVDKNVAKGIQERLMRNYEERIGKIMICDYYELKSIHFEEYDLLVTDIEMASLKEVPLPILRLDSFFRQAIKSDIKDILSMQKFNYKVMMDNFKEETFYVYKGIESKESFFKAFFQHLQKTYPSDASFLEELILRDQISSIEAGNKVAFMKTMTSHLPDSFISVNILDKPITWKYEAVQIVIIAHIGKEDAVSAEFFENGYLGNVIKTTFFKQGNIMKLLRFQDFDTLTAIVKQRVDLPMFIHPKEK